MNAEWREYVFACKRAGCDPHDVPQFLKLIDAQDAVVKAAEEQAQLEIEEQGLFAMKDRLMRSDWKESRDSLNQRVFANHEKIRAALRDLAELKLE